MTPLRALKAGIRPLLDENFRSGASISLPADPYIVDANLGRLVDIEPLQAILSEAVRRFRHQPEKADTWLAPRVHASLRLSRREAGDRRLWWYLNIVASPDFVRWRFGDATEGSESYAPLDRFVGEDSRNTIGRLWWAAELTRNGPDYSDTVSVMRSSRFSISWQPLDCIHHRPTAIAICRFDREFNDGKGLTDSQSARLAKAFNLRLATLCLDALAFNPPLDAVAINEWCHGKVDETKYMGDQLPEGPDEDQVPATAIEAVSGVLESLATEIDLADFKRASRHLRDAETEELPVDAVAT